MKHAKYIISVGEPWDFESLDGQNKIKGKVLSIKSNKCLVFKSNYCLDFGDIKGYILILSPRFIENDFNKLTERIDINGGLLLKEYHENLSEQELIDNSKFVIIGSISKESFAL